MPVISATGNRGFTLLELLVVLAIMVLLAGAWPFAAPRLFPAQQLRNEGQRLVAALRSARMTARVNGDSTNRGVAGNRRQGTSRARSSHQLPTGVIAHIRSDDVSMKSLGVMFFPDGSSTGGMIDLVLPNHRVSVEVGTINRPCGAHRMTARRDAGFTLIEMVIAFAILGLSLSALYATFQSALSRTRHDAHLSEATMLARSVLARAGTEWPMIEGSSQGCVE